MGALSIFMIYPLIGLGGLTFLIRGGMVNNTGIQLVNYINQTTLMQQMIRLTSPVSNQIATFSQENPIFRPVAEILLRRLQNPGAVIVTSTAGFFFITPYLAHRMGWVNLTGRNSQRLLWIGRGFASIMMKILRHIIF